MSPGGNRGLSEGFLQPQEDAAAVAGQQHPEAGEPLVRQSPAVPH